MLRFLLCLILGHRRRYRFNSYTLNDQSPMGEYHSCERCHHWFLTTDVGRTFKPCKNPYTLTSDGAPHGTN